MNTIARLAALLLAMGWLLTGHTQAANPYLPAWEYIPDGEPRVFGERLYIYGSHDRAGSERFCDVQLRVWSAPLNNLSDWTDHGISFATVAHEGHADDVPWSDKELYAPDVVEKGGKYYLYAYIVGSPCAVAVSDTPEGPFKTLGKLRSPAGAEEEFGNWGQFIDPGVLVDGEKVYIYWGYKESHMAELDPSTMRDIVPGTYIQGIIPKTAPFNFFEACSPRKLGDTYYLIYADSNILVALTSDKATGPFVYRGPVIRNGRGYPGGNIHGGLAQIQNQWYIFYHRMTNNTLFSRQACVERVEITAAGDIPEVEMTSLGFEEALNPYRYWSAHHACVLTGGNFITETKPEEHPVVNNREGSVIGFKYFDFGTPDSAKAIECSIEVKANEEGWITLWSEATESGRGACILGTFEIHGATGATGWTKLKATIPPIKGRQAVYFRFNSKASDAFRCDFKGLEFRKP